MEVKLSSYNLGNSWTCPKEITPGLRVCSSNSSKTLGVVVDIGPLKQGRYGTPKPEYLAILWVTGKKKGTRQELSPSSLAAVNAFRADIKSYVDALDKLNEEADKFGQ